jgi:hypothetical protein
MPPIVSQASLLLAALVTSQAPDRPAQTRPPAAAGAGLNSAVTANATTESPAEKVRKALEKPFDFEFNEQPIDVAIAQLRGQTNLNFLLDKVTLDQAGIDIKETFNFKQPKVKLRAGLRLMLAQHNMGIAILGDTILVTTQESAVQRQLYQPVSLDLENVPLNAALRRLARETATNLVIDGRLAKECSVPVTLQLDDVPLETAVRVLAETAGVKPVRLGNVLYLTTEARADKIRAETDPLAPPAPVGVSATPPPAGAAENAKK